MKKNLCSLYLVRLGVVVTLFLALTLSKAFAVNYYVSKDGNDETNSGDSATSPFASLTKAVSTANTGDTIFIAPSTTPYLLSAGIAITKQLTISGSENPYDTILDFQNKSNGFTLSDKGSKGSLVYGLTIQNCLKANAAAVAWYDTQGSTIENCVVRWCSTSTGGAQAILRTVNASSLITGCTVVSNTFYSQGISVTAAPILLNGKLINSIVADNVLKNGTGKAGALFVSGGSYVINCTIVRNSAPNVGGVYVNNGYFYNTIIRDNFLTTDQSSSDVFLSDPSYNTRFHNCCVKSISDFAPNQGNVQGLYAINYPSGKYALSSLSNCIDAGSTDGIEHYIPEKDIHGNPRITGDSIDIGAVEYAPGVEPFLAFMLTEPTNINLPEGTSSTDLTLSATTTMPGDTISYKWEILNSEEEVIATFEGENYPQISHAFTYGTFSVRLTAENLSAQKTSSTLYENLINISPGVLYVDINNSSPQYPYATRETAANDIASAITVAPAKGATIKVAPGTYVVSAVLVVDKSIHLIGEGGLESTIIDGNEKTRILSVESDGAVIEGLTLQRGGGSGLGGNLYVCANATIKNCRITACKRQSIQGGGACLSLGKLLNCIIDNNSISGQGPAGVDLRGGSMINCLVYNNYATSGASMGGGGVKAGGLVLNCTIVSNRSDKAEYPAGTNLSNDEIRNCIIAYNYNGSNGGFWDNIKTISSKVQNSAIYPVGNLDTATIESYGNITQNPSFSFTTTPKTIQEALEGYKLSRESPCRNSGNNSLFDLTKYGSLDILGNQRIDRNPPKGIIDMGAIEMPFNNPATMLKMK